MKKEDIKIPKEFELCRVNRALVYIVGLDIPPFYIRRTVFPTIYGIKIWWGRKIEISDLEIVLMEDLKINYYEELYNSFNNKTKHDVRIIQLDPTGDSSHEYLFKDCVISILGHSEFNYESDDISNINISFSPRKLVII